MKVRKLPPVLTMQGTRTASRIWPEPHSPA